MLISGNGSSYSCQAFADFARDWGFVHRTSSPLHPISNDHGEVMVGVAKKILKKAKESKQDPGSWNTGIAHYRTVASVLRNVSQGEPDQ